MLSTRSSSYTPICLLQRYHDRSVSHTPSFHRVDATFSNKAMEGLSRCRKCFGMQTITSSGVCMLQLVCALLKSTQKCRQACSLPSATSSREQYKIPNLKPWKTPESSQDATFPEAGLRQNKVIQKSIKMSRNTILQNSKRKR